MIDMLLINGTVITMNKEREIIEGGAIAIDGGRIISVGYSEELKSKYKAKKNLDCKNHVILPGFVDAHAHGGHSAFKSIIKDTSYWMPLMTHIYKHYLTDEFWYYEARLAALERLYSGVTTGVSVLGSQPRCDDPIIALNHAKGYSEIGIKNIICTGPCSTPWPHSFSRIIDGQRIMKEITFEQMLNSLETVIEKLNNTDNGKIRVYVAPLGIVTSLDPSNPSPADRCVRLTEHDLKQSREMRRIAKKYNTRIHTDAFGGMIKLASKDKENALLGPDVHIHHCIGLSMDEVMILAETGTNISFSPIEVKQLKENTPIIELMELGVTVAVGTDGSMRGSSFDIFSAMRRAQRITRVAYKDDFYLPSEKLLEMTTIDAAKCIGLDNEIGSLEIGKRADIVTINMMKPHLMPRFNIVDLIITNATHSDVDTVIVNGDILLKGGNTLDINESDIMLEIEEEVRETIKRTDIEMFAYPSKLQWGKSKIYFDKIRFDIEENREDGGYY